jgi:hypothetical protein
MTSTKALDRVSPYRSILMLLVVLFLAAHLTACDPVTDVYSLWYVINDSVTGVLEAPYGAGWIITGVNPVSGESYVGEIVSSGNGLYKIKYGLFDPAKMQYLVKEASKLGYKITSFELLPEDVQALIVSKVAQYAPMAETLGNTLNRIASSPMSQMFSLPQEFYDGSATETCRYTKDGYTCDL